MSPNKKFWVIVGLPRGFHAALNATPNFLYVELQMGYRPSIIWWDPVSARKEVDRLARIAPDKLFFILEAMDYTEAIFSVSSVKTTTMYPQPLLMYPPGT